ncbi:Luciferase-like monooxygenase [Anatilimnocola aggregata]|uniref:Luciferase-like monooxygenase n=1 Tax=Anatilimnocola aggregata TaxID=2528021 RepID=A0A517Y981_9BACT|nr:LLM class flavin-dependent oxidoreductase [Anatilimnocola aggregata]QDU26794.1 Luciferase-like monooxygenase [Anatilimnocola aggregata]
MIDVISGGRLIAGLVVGGGPEYYSFSINPTNARAMYTEALDLVVRAWTEPGPFEHYGEFWKLKYVNPWPRPLQQPHPPIWIPGAGSKETIEFVPNAAMPTWHSLFSRRLLPTQLRYVREACQKNGYEADPEQLGWLCPITLPRVTRKPGKNTKSTSCSSRRSCSRPGGLSAWLHQSAVARGHSSGLEEVPDEREDAAGNRRRRVCHCRQPCHRAR